MKARVRGGDKGVRFISLEDWQDERKAARGKLPKAKDRRMERMEAKLKRRTQNQNKRKSK